jgi:hypothetical protein
MTGSLVIFIIVHMAALIYFAEMLRRVYNKSKEYELSEDSRTLPFGFVRLRYVVVIYILAYLVWVVASVFLFIAFVLPDSFDGGNAVPMMRGIDLNL